ncbi:pentapeptide repeat-containing protein [Phenylobacterium montanum]|uniref:Pentapeptide repeat-containing protein n=1 Tax=Phenylobacterium montanum TaxID=2823693 RepID=A0A975FZ38_9CAUL|nr:pentapeptide repeat-containing protein [Caulobacter sp. S6]QUD88123.1 pentapeptide repeat-containing protein [Caulobacter sp. S6]
MKSIAIALALSLAALPALAQNAAEIAKVEAGAGCPHCNLFQIDLYNKQVRARDFAGARMRQGDFSLSVFNKSNFAGADLRDVNAYGALFGGANMRNADLTNATFVGAYLEGANLSGARLSGANFSGAQMDRAVGLTQGQLNKACGDETTTLPRRLHIPACK